MKGFIAGFGKIAGKKPVKALGKVSGKGLVILKTAIFSLLLICSGFSLAQVAQEPPPNLEMCMELETVNINQADAEAIALVLTGIGINKAEAIVAYRNENGEFGNVDDLIMVKGIGEFTVLRNEEKIVFD